MSRPGREDDPAPHPGALRPTPPTTLVGWGVVGLVLGLALRPVCERLGLTPPLISWAQPLALVLLAAILGYTAWATYRSLQVRHERLQPHQAVNRFVLARACAMVAALVAGGYLGYGLSWIGNPAELADERQLRCWIAGVAGLLAAAAAVALERACRVRDDEDDGDPA
ncbi:DUF3180 domain-containing protein [Nocardioides sp. BGMRC 2183]|nr:DUF3180 domain-containing protein [Nocardioides sp. BGMRC 2183]